MDNELGILPNALNVPQDPIFEKWRGPRSFCIADCSFSMNAQPLMDVLPGVELVVPKEWSRLSKEEEKVWSMNSQMSQV